MLRKLTVIAVTVILALGVFTGCSNDTVTSSDSTSALQREDNHIEGTITAEKEISSTYVEVLYFDAVSTGYDDTNNPYRIDLEPLDDNELYWVECTVYYVIGGSDVDEQLFFDDGGVIIRNFDFSR